MPKIMSPAHGRLCQLLITILDKYQARRQDVPLAIAELLPTCGAALESRDERLKRLAYELLVDACKQCIPAQEEQASA